MQKTMAFLALFFVEVSLTHPLVFAGFGGQRAKYTARIFAYEIMINKSSGLDTPVGCSPINFNGESDPITHAAL